MNAQALLQGDGVMTLREVKSLYRSPVRMPNGLQWYGGELYVMDQLTDDVFVLDEKGSVKRVIWTETVNGSGITVSDGYIWTCLLYTSPSPRDGLLSRMPSSA